MTEISTVEALERLGRIKDSIKKSEDIAAITFAIEKVISSPIRKKYKITCNVAGDLEDKLTTEVYADSISDAYARGEHQLYKENTNVRHLEHIKVREVEEK